jgi:hypothetical protein
MKKILKAVFMTVALGLLGIGSAMAQVSEDGMGKVLPAELFVCKYRDRQDKGDLDRVITRWTSYMDERGNDDYAAWTLTPYHYGQDTDFDVIWMGAYKDGNAMGAGVDQWFAEGGDINDAFEEVLDCNAHEGFASAMYKSPPNNETPVSSIISMMNCKLQEGRRYADVKAAEMKWAEYMTSTGSTAGTWHWFPTYGGVGGGDFDYKIVTAYSNYSELGADWERNANGGGRETGIELFSDVDDCDTARVYIATSRRAAQLRE